MTREQALATLAKYIPQQQVHYHNPTIEEFASQSFYITETEKPLILMPHQTTILSLALDPTENFSTIIYSAPKKSGKTAIAALIGRYIAETSGRFAEVYCIANDLKQAEGRIFQAIKESLSLDPRWDVATNSIPSVWKQRIYELEYLLKQAKVEAIPLDYKGEAGSNPDITLWSELWGFTTTAARKMWAEMTPPPTKPKAKRWIETYAGFEGESDILEGQWNLATNQDAGGYRLTHDDLARYNLTWPFNEDELPLFINREARLFAYIDQGPIARRMPWQTPSYYAAQEKELTDPNDFLRLHSNEWVSAISEFIPIIWWHQCFDPNLPPLGADEPIVIGADASVSNDCTAIVGVSRHPHNPSRVAVRFVQVWKPTKSNPLDYGQTIEPAIRNACSRYNVKQVAYDPYQLHDLMTRLFREQLVWTKPFSQLGERMKADKQLQDVIRDGDIAHHGEPELEDHLKQCAAKKQPNSNTQLRIVKKSEKSTIDAVVATSMAVAECKRLMLD